MKTVLKLLSLQSAVYLVLPLCFLLTVALSNLWNLICFVVYCLIAQRFDSLVHTILFCSTLFAVPVCLSVSLLALSNKLFVLGTKDFKNSDLFANIVLFMTMVGFFLTTLGFV